MLGSDVGVMVGEGKLTGVMLGKEISSHLWGVGKHIY